MKVQASAYQKFIHSSPRKLRLIADAIRGKSVMASLDVLKFSTKRAAKTLRTVLVQAKANAVTVHQVPEASLIVKEILVEEGPRIKRWRPVARGMAHSIIKRTSHVKITLEGTLPDPVKPSAKKKDK
jgi:large subunit ribosomal protein L22